MQKIYKFNHSDVLQILGAHVAKLEGIKGDFQVRLSLNAREHEQAFDITVEVEKNAK